MISLRRQILRFLMVGGIAFVIDFGLLYLLTDWMHLQYMLSACISFSVSTVFNYWASMRYIFSGTGDGKRNREFLIFVALCLVALGLNELGMWLLVEGIRMHYLFAKIIVTGVVMVFNFVTRKIFLDQKR